MNTSRARISGVLQCEQQACLAVLAKQSKAKL